MNVIFSSTFIIKTFSASHFTEMYYALEKLCVNFFDDNIFAILKKKVRKPTTNVGKQNPENK